MNAPQPLVGIDQHLHPCAILGPHLDPCKAKLPSGLTCDAPRMIVQTDPTIEGTPPVGVVVCLRCDSPEAYTEVHA